MDRRRDGIVRSTCTLCSDGCGVLVHMKDGRPVRVEGDPTTRPARVRSACAAPLPSRS